MFAITSVLLCEKEREREREREREQACKRRARMPRTTWTAAAMGKQPTGVGARGLAKSSKSEQSKRPGATAGRGSTRVVEVGSPMTATVAPMTAK